MPLKNDRKIVLIGHTGFVGSVCYSHLKEQKGRRIIGLSSRQVDLNQKSAVRKLCSYFDTNTVVIFIAAITREQSDDFATFQKNINMVMHTAMALEQKSVRKFIYISTISVYGLMLKSGVIDEQTPVSPDSFYTLAKLSWEVTFTQVAAAKNFPCLVLRLPRVYGWGDVHAKYGPSFLVRSAVENNRIKIFGDGKEKRAFIFVEDVAKLLSKACDDASMGVVNAVPSRGQSYQDIAKVLLKEFGSVLKKEVLSRSGKAHDELFDNHVLTKTFPDFSFLPLEQGLIKSCQQIRET